MICYFMICLFDIHHKRFNILKNNRGEEDYKLYWGHKNFHFFFELFWRVSSTKREISMLDYLSVEVKSIHLIESKASSGLQIKVV
jgi:hypothetical protein